MDNAPAAQQVAKVLCTNTYNQPGQQVIQLGQQFTESLLSPITGADRLWYCPQHPQSDFYENQAFAQAQITHGMTAVTTDATLAALPVGARIFLYFSNQGWRDGYYATIKIE